MSALELFSEEPARMSRSMSALELESAVHERLYKDAISQRERQRQYMAMQDEAQQRVPDFALDPELYERLHRDAEDIAESRAELADAYYRAQLPPEDDRRCVQHVGGAYCNDAGVFERLTAP